MKFAGIDDRSLHEMSPCRMSVVEAEGDMGMDEGFSFEERDVSHAGENLRRFVDGKRAIDPVLLIVKGDSGVLNGTDGKKAPHHRPVRREGFENGMVEIITTGE